MSIKELVRQCAQSVYNSLGSGHSEAIYHAAMEVELRLYGLRYSTKSPISLTYRGHTVGWCIADLILHRDAPHQDIVVELKATTYVNITVCVFSLRFTNVQLIFHLDMLLDLLKKRNFLDT